MRVRTQYWPALVSASALNIFFAFALGMQTHALPAWGRLFVGAFFGSILGCGWACVVGRPAAEIELTSSGLKIFRGVGEPEVARFAEISGLRRVFARNGVSLLIDVKHAGSFVRYMATAIPRPDADLVVSAITTKATAMAASARAPAHASLVASVAFFAVSMVVAALVGGGAAALLLAFPLVAMATLVSFLFRTAGKDLIRRAAA